MSAAIVTGASSGIGLSVTLKLLASGYLVVGTGRDEERLTEAFSLTDPSIRERLHFFVGDLSTQQGCEALVACATGILAGRPLSLLVNNAGAGILNQQIGNASTTSQLFPT